MFNKKGFKTEFDDSNWPIVIIKLTGNVDNDSDFQKFTEVWSGLYLRSSQEKRPFKLIFDTRQLKQVKLSYLIAQAKFLDSVKVLTELWMDRCSILVKSWKIKRMIHFVFTFYKPVRPFKVFLKEDEAKHWIASNLKGEEPTVEDEDFSAFSGVNGTINLTE